MTNILNNPDTPNFIYGTAWKEQQTTELTRLAVEHGFRAIDTANQRKHYHEAAVGDAITDAIDDGLLERDDLFIQTKFTHLAGQDDRLPYDPDAAIADQVRQSFDSSLDHLQTDYIDSYLLHGPAARTGLADADREVWRTMEALVDSDRLHTIGASNVSPTQLDALLDLADPPPDWVQNRCFARTEWDQEVRDICRANDITYQGFSLLTANTRELNTEPVADIARSHDCTIPQIVFRFALQSGILPLTGTTDPQHMHHDLAVDQFQLSPAELDTIHHIASG